jgi:hypothetical protein
MPRYIGLATQHSRRAILYYIKGCPAILVCQLSIPAEQFLHYFKGCPAILVRQLSIPAEQFYNILKNAPLFWSARSAFKQSNFILYKRMPCYIGLPAQHPSRAILNYINECPAKLVCLLSFPAEQFYTILKDAPIYWPASTAFQQSNFILY